MKPRSFESQQNAEVVAHIHQLQSKRTRWQFKSGLRSARGRGNQLLSTFTEPAHPPQWRKMPIKKPGLKTQSFLSTTQKFWELGMQFLKKVILFLKDKFASGCLRNASKGAQTNRQCPNIYTPSHCCWFLQLDDQYGGGGGASAASLASSTQTH